VGDGGLCCGVCTRLGGSTPAGGGQEDRADFLESHLESDEGELIPVGTIRRGEPITIELRKSSAKDQRACSNSKGRKKGRN